jgi:hypothetical protein
MPVVGGGVPPPAGITEAVGLTNVAVSDGSPVGIGVGGMSVARVGVVVTGVTTLLDTVGGGVGGGHKMIAIAATLAMTSRPTNPSAITMNILFGPPPAGATSDMLLSPFSQNVIRSIYVIASDLHKPA